MHLRKVSRVVLCAVILAAALLRIDSPLVAANPDQMFMEMVMIYVDCNNASLMTTVNVGSDNNTLIHFPDPVDLNDAHLENATAVAVMSSSEMSILVYSFEGISETEAEANAEAFTSSIEGAVGVDFTWNATETVDTEVNINYTGPGQSDMTSFVNSMVSDCVHPDIDGFSNAILSLATKTTTSLFVFGAGRESVGLNWMVIFGAMSGSTISTGTGDHTIDVLYLLGVSVLTPSSYSFNATEGYYQSTVSLLFASTTPITFVSCVPPLKEDFDNLSERGWMHTLPMFNYAMFYFGNESSGVEALTFTFGGTVIPEFTPSTALITLILTAACIIAFQKRLLRKNRGSPLFLK